jgi:hypothetical protein
VEVTDMDFQVTAFPFTGTPEPSGPLDRKVSGDRVAYLLDRAEGYPIVEAECVGLGIDVEFMNVEIPAHRSLPV